MSSELLLYLSWGIAGGSGIFLHMCALAEAASDYFPKPRPVMPGWKILLLGSLGLLGGPVTFVTGTLHAMLET